MQKIANQVIDVLRAKGIHVYFVALEIDDDYPYLVYTFDPDIVDAAKEAYTDSRLIPGVFDDYVMTTAPNLINEIARIVEDRYQSIH